jgi:hypothetical protein
MFFYRIPDPNFSIPDPDPHHSINPKPVFELSNKLSGIFIPDPDFSHPGIKKVPDRESAHGLAQKLTN